MPLPNNTHIATSLESFELRRVYTQKAEQCRLRSTYGFLLGKILECC